MCACSNQRVAIRLDAVAVGLGAIAAGAGAIAVGGRPSLLIDVWTDHPLFCRQTCQI